MIGSGKRRSLLVVGSVAYDTIDGPFGLHEQVLGGSASFFSVAASYFTDKVSVIAIVGDDFDAKYLELLEEKKVDISGIERAAGKSFHWHGRYSDDLTTRESISTELGVFADFSPKLDANHSKAELLFLGNIHPSLQTSVLDQVDSPALVCADTMNFWIDGNRDALEKTLERVHTLVINDEEARQLAEEHNLVRAAAAIRNMGPNSLVIKRGDAGALLFYDGGIFAAPALPLEDVKDPTGAGDTFAGGFMGYLARAGSLDPDAIRTAMIFGSVMASFVVEKFSLDGLLGLARADIQARFDAFGNLTRFESIHL